MWLCYRPIFHGPAYIHFLVAGPSFWSKLPSKRSIFNNLSFLCCTKVPLLDPCFVLSGWNYHSQFLSWSEAVLFFDYKVNDDCISTYALHSNQPIRLGALDAWGSYPTLLINNDELHWFPSHSKWDTTTWVTQHAGEAQIEIRVTKPSTKRSMECGNASVSSCSLLQLLQCTKRESCR